MLTLRDGAVRELAPDLVVRHEPSRSVVICDVTVPFEIRWVACDDAMARKVSAIYIFNFIV
ncbi:hypothetical protein ALC56_04798 [Trachymyrmex septentrionalis]|uniref:Uncharacterized protein n=1 Tax=Trachymyrmex septentrionalis TaxID=34720 RepID=A0A195FKW9_9HYME|nr:hypothetical protein ALC56_04798 [Trachymyrmex septentrionalis]